MRLTDIHQCEVRPGRLVEFTLSPATVAAARELPDDARPPAYIQESHLRTVRSAREEGSFLRTWLGVAFDLPGEVDLDALEAALQLWTLRHETLRSGLREVGGGVRRFTLDADAVALSRTVIGDFPDAEKLAGHLEARFGQATYALGWPNFLYAAVVRDESTSVYMVFDHSNVDGCSMLRIPGAVRALYESAAAGRGGQPVADSSYVDFCELERVDADRIDAGHEAVVRWREFIRRCGGAMPNFPLELGLGAGPRMPEQRVTSGMVVDADTAEAFEALCRPYGGGIVGYLAATSLAVQEINPTDVFRTVVLFHTRAKSRWSDSVGWYVGGVPVEIPCARPSSFPDALATVRGALRANRFLARIPLARVMHLLGDEFAMESSEHVSLSYLDGRDTPGSEGWEEQRVYGLGGVTCGDKVGVWINRVHEGVWLACRYPDTAVADKSMRQYAERMRDILLTAIS
ncbi:condensation domain-containing protein [Streptomyces sp. NPDC101191]|uniref:condensation domain-containing protein n=1 Tax=Streptomyces sp. NPDC101191 TaxID=3366126 RepID=UPI0038160605